MQDDAIVAEVRQRRTQGRGVRGGRVHGRTYEVPAILTGPAGRQIAVLTVWLVRRSEDFPRFITAYPRARRWGSRSWRLWF